MDPAGLEAPNGADDCADWIAQIFDYMSGNEKIERTLSDSGEGLGIDGLADLDRLAFEISLQCGQITDVSIGNPRFRGNGKGPGASAYLEAAARDESLR